jgi:hypothetical protein
VLSSEIGRAQTVSATRGCPRRLQRREHPRRCLALHGWCGPGVSRTSISWEVYEYPDGEDPGRAAGALFDNSLLTDSEEGDGLAVSVHRSPGIAAQVAKIPTLEWLQKQEQTIL